mmetsp:Transcript_16900/g.53692  ORF Transcript_16900/g.53692 Transcript_16900/m.53692 type:complete len:234 (+) Transcript_16900:672-1373(+)
MDEGVPHDVGDRQRVVSAAGEPPPAGAAHAARGRRFCTRRVPDRGRRGKWKRADGRVKSPHSAAQLRPDLSARRARVGAPAGRGGRDLGRLLLQRGQGSPGLHGRGQAALRGRAAVRGGRGFGGPSARAAAGVVADGAARLPRQARHRAGVRVHRAPHPARHGGRRGGGRRRRRRGGGGRGRGPGCRRGGARVSLRGWRPPRSRHAGAAAGSRPRPQARPESDAAGNGRAGAD